MRVIVAGSRDFVDKEMIRQRMNELWLTRGEYIVVSGMARGVDRLAYQLAKEASVPVRQYPAQWERYGRRAGYLRNEEMAEESDYLLAFWDGKSRGTKHMIQLAQKQGLEVEVVLVERD